MSLRQVAFSPVSVIVFCVMSTTVMCNGSTRSLTNGWIDLNQSASQTCRLRVRLQKVPQVSTASS